MRRAQHAAISADRDVATKAAFEACVAAAKELIGDGKGLIRSGVAIGRVTPNEWGWFVSTVVSAWVGSRAAQAAVEG
jgi:hypothetical protein